MKKKSIISIAWFTLINYFTRIGIYFLILIFIISMAISTNIDKINQIFEDDHNDSIILINDINKSKMSDDQVKSYFSEDYNFVKNNDVYSAKIIVSEKVIVEVVDEHKHVANEIYRPISTLSNDIYLLNNNVDPAIINDKSKDSNFVINVVNSENKFSMLFITILLQIAGLIFLYSMTTGNIIAEEKSNRITETLLVYCKASDLIWGKIIGTIPVILTLLLTIFLSAFAFDNKGFNEIIESQGAISILLIVFQIIIAFMVFSAIYIAASSFVNTMEDTVISSMLVMGIFVFSSFLNMVAIVHTQEFDSYLVYIPFVNLFTTIIIVMQGASLILIMKVFVIQIIYAVLIIVIAGKVFNFGINYVKKGKIKL